MGQIVRKDGGKSNLEESKIKNFPYPKNQKESKNFLGQAGYYRGFIKHFAKIVIQLLKKNVKFEFDKRSQQAFAILK